LPEEEVAVLLVLAVAVQEGIVNQYQLPQLGQLPL
jgi:hypothetical protein